MSDRLLDFLGEAAVAIAHALAISAFPNRPSPLLRHLNWSPIAMEKIDPAEAKRRFTIERLKFNSGAMSTKEHLAFGQAAIGASIAKAASFLSKLELMGALHTFRNIVKSESSLLLLETICEELERGTDFRTIFLTTAQVCTVMDEQLDPKRKELHDLLSSKLDLLIASETTCFALEEV